LGSRDKEDIERAKKVLKEEPHLKKVRVPDIKKFRYAGMVVTMGVVPYILTTFLAAIGVLVLIGGLGIGEKKYVIPTLLISISLIIPVIIYIILIFTSTWKLGEGRFTYSPNLIYHNEKGIFYNRYLDKKNTATFVPWEHIKVVNYSKSWKSITVVPDAMFRVSKRSCEPDKIVCNMLILSNKAVQDLVMAIYHYEVPVMKGERKVFREDLVKVH